MPMPILSDTARVVLTAAAAPGDHVALLPERLPVATQRAVVLSLLRAGLLVAAEDGSRHVLHITDAGLHAAGAGPGAVAAEDTEEDDRPRHEQNGVPDERLHRPEDENNGGLLHPRPPMPGHSVQLTAEARQGRVVQQRC